MNENISLLREKLFITVKVRFRDDAWAALRRLQLRVEKLSSEWNVKVELLRVRDDEEATERRLLCDEENDEPNWKWSPLIDTSLPQEMIASVLDKCLLKDVDDEEIDELKITVEESISVVGIIRIWWRETVDDTSTLCLT